MKNKFKKAFLNADSRRLHANGRRLFQPKNLRLSALDLCKSAFKKVFLELTDFECKVLKATLKIPFGQTRTYQWVARQVGLPKAARAVGNALKKNPYPLIIPCHRVIKSSGAIGGYTGGRKAKEHLLELENKLSLKFKQ